MNRSKRYYDRLFVEHGEAMFCPVCLDRPCEVGCSLGFTEEELMALTLLLEDSDPPRKKRRKRKDT